MCKFGFTLFAVFHWVEIIDKIKKLKLICNCNNERWIGKYKNIAISKQAYSVSDSILGGIR